MRDIINYTTMSKEIRVRIPIGISYEADVKQAKKIIEKICLELERVMRTPAPKVVVKMIEKDKINYPVPV